MVDWSLPLEAVNNSTGQVIDVHLDREGWAGKNPDDDGDGWIEGEGYDGCSCVGPDGFEAHGKWVIRNKNAIRPVATLDTTVPLIRKWATDRNLIEGATSQAQTVKLFEEGGEVAHAVARGDRDGLKDGIGDMIVVLTILAAQNGLTVEECVAAAYDEIKDRKGRMVDGVFIRDV